MIESEIRLRRRVNGYGRGRTVIGGWDVGIRTQRAATRCRGRHGRDRCDALRLANGFVIGEEKGVVLYNRPSDCPAELVALEWRNGLGGIVEIILSVKPAIAEKFVSAAVKSVRSRSRNCVDYSS